MRPKGNPQELFERRRKAVLQVVEHKRAQAEVARELGVHPNSINAWVQLYRDGGIAALRVRNPPGRPRALSDAQAKDVVACILKGPKACGFDTELWTLPRIARLIEERHQVKYDVDHLSRLMRSWGLSWQKPATRPIERNEQAIAHWLKHDWRSIKKKRRG